MSEQPQPPSPTDARKQIERELHRWSSIYAGDAYYYGEEPGPMARRAVRYHRGFMPRGGTALDAGCGEGQDLAFLAERGYTSTGVEFTGEGAEKARRLLAERGLSGEVLHQDLGSYLGIPGSTRGKGTAEDEDDDEDEHDSAPPNAQRPTPNATYDLVLAVNSIQFMGEAAAPALDRLLDRVAPGGVIGLSLFGREAGEPALSGPVWFFTWEELMARFEGWQRLEGARLWQWNVATDRAQPFLTLIARKAPPSRSLISGIRR